MFTLRFTNVSCSSQGREFHDVEDAYNAGRETGFEFTVWYENQLVLSWSVFGGRRERNLR